MLEWQNSSHLVGMILPSMNMKSKGHLLASFTEKPPHGDNETRDTY
jgi:hypothetical protein